VYTNADSVDDTEMSHLYPQEVLNATEISGMPPHRLVLKVGMLRNMYKLSGCANGTDLTVLHLLRNVIHAEIQSGTGKGKQVFIPRMVLAANPEAGKKFIPLKRRQFPVRQAFAMTINKAQGQTLRVMGLFSLRCLDTASFTWPFPE
jgi:ATP-dependent DNA helicase PIF1